MIQKRLSLASYTAMEHQRIAREEKAYAGVQCIVCGVNVKANDDDSNVTDHHSKDASDGADSHDRANDVIECPHCNAVRYCSIYHQQIDWQHHRGVCEIRSKELQSRQDMEIHITREDASFDLHQCYVCTYDKEEKQKMERGQMEEELKREEKEKKEKKEKGEREETEEVQDGEIGREKGENGGNKHAVYCNACNAVRYCSLAHRFSDWHRHQQLCQFRLMRNGEAEEIDGDCVEDEEDEDVDEDDENEIDHEAQADKRHNVEIGEKEGKYNEDTDNKDEREKDHRNGSFNPDDVIGGERSGLFRTYLIQRAAKFKKSADDDTEEDSRYDADERDHYDGGGVSDGAYKAEEAEVCVDDDGNIILDDDGW